MSSLIFPLIILAISAIINNASKNKKQNDKQMPPFNSKPVQKPAHTPAQSTERQPARTLEDFANEIFGQLNEKVKPAPPVVEQPLQAPPPVQAQVQVQERVVPPSVARPKMRTEMTERPLVTKLKEQNDSFTVVPKNKKALMQAVVMAEILGPPKAKQR